MHKHKYTITLNLLTYIGALEPARDKAISGTKVNYKLLDLGPITPTAVKLIAIENRLNCSLVVLTLGAILTISFEIFLICSVCTLFIYNFDAQKISADKLFDFYDT